MSMNWIIKNLFFFLFYCISLTLLAQNQGIGVEGAVKDVKGESLIGVSIQEVGTTNGTVTDIDGNYKLFVNSSDAVLRFSYIGFEDMQVNVDNRNKIDIEMIEATSELDEIVVVGYGTMRKSDLTGAVKRVSMEDNPAANISLTQALAGAAAGVNILHTSGKAGSDGSLSIRGQNSLSASNTPLIVLDGIIYNGALNEINPGDVESIDILKDASSAAVYGARASNGVIIITTKQGKTDKPTITFNAYYGFQDMTNSPMKVMNAEQFAVRMVDYYYQQELYSWYRTMPTSNIGKPVRPDINNKEIVASRLRTREEQDNYLAGNEIDWVDEVTQVAPVQNYQLSVSSRNERTSYYLSGSYTNEEGILLNDKFKRLSTQVRVNTEITNWLNVEFNSSFSHLDFSGREADLSLARWASPLADRKIGPDYNLELTGESYTTYPLAPLYIDNSEYRDRLFMIGKGVIDIPWIPGLTNESNMSYTNTNSFNNNFYPVKTVKGRVNRGTASKVNSQRINWAFNNITSYNRTFGDHRVNSTLLFSREHSNAEGTNANASGFGIPILGYNNLSFGEIQTVNSSAWEENALSYMARANYSYLNRYLFTATYRRDGFSAFGANRKYADFPSASVAWVASEESFVKNLINDTYLKLRLSYGKNGNQGIGRYSTFAKMGLSSYVYDSSTALTLYPSSLGNDDLGWETTSSLNLGLDFSTLNQRISGSIDVYNSNTTDVLVQRALPLTTGFSNIWTNIGEVQNKGIELELTTINIDNQNRQNGLSWTSNFTFSLNRDKITKLYGGENDMDIGNSWFVGESIGAIYDYEMVGGLWTEEELYSGNIYNNWYPGQYKYVDQNDDGVITAAADRKIIGNRNPNYRFSINNALTYKNFTLTFFINAVMGGNGYFMKNNQTVVNVNENSDYVYRVNASAVRPYWTPDNGVNNSTGIYHAPPVLSGIYESRSFIRLQELTLAYQLPSKVLNPMNIASCQLYVASKNPYVWTKWSGWDPETGTSNFPAMRNITFGIRFSL